MKNQKASSIMYPAVIRQIRWVPAVAALAFALPAGADSRRSAPADQPVPTYADLVDLADQAPLVVQVRARSVTRIEPERSPGLRAGWVRVLIAGKTEALMGGKAGIGADLRYLVDVPLDAKGKPPRLQRKSMIVFASPVPGRPGELQLVKPDAQLAWDETLAARVRGILVELADADAPPRITAVREAIHVTGALAGEGETQLFLAAANDAVAAITVSRAPGRAPAWSVSFSELVAPDAAPPARDTLGWYRLACQLPAQLPPGTMVAGSPADRVAAAVDYRFVREQLGACPRNRR